MKKKISCQAIGIAILIILSSLSIFALEGDSPVLQLRFNSPGEGVNSASTWGQYKLFRGHVYANSTESAWFVCYKRVGAAFLPDYATDVQVAPNTALLETATTYEANPTWWYLHLQSWSGEPGRTNADGYIRLMQSR